MSYDIEPSPASPEWDEWHERRAAEEWQPFQPQPAAYYKWLYHRPTQTFHMWATEGAGRAPGSERWNDGYQSPESKRDLITGGVLVGSDGNKRMDVYSKPDDYGPDDVRATVRGVANWLGQNTAATKTAWNPFKREQQPLQPMQSEPPAQPVAWPANALQQATPGAAQTQERFTPGKTAQQAFAEIVAQNPYATHMTNVSRVESIGQLGLVPFNQQTPMVFLAPEHGMFAWTKPEQGPEGWATSDPAHGFGAAFKIDLRQLDPSKVMWAIPDMEIAYAGQIPPAAMQRIAAEKTAMPEAELAPQFRDRYQQGPEYVAPGPEGRWSPQLFRGYDWVPNWDAIQKLYHLDDWSAPPVEIRSTRPGTSAWLNAWGEYNPKDRNFYQPQPSIVLHPFLTPEQANETLWHELQHHYQNHEGRYDQTGYDHTYQDTGAGYQQHPIEVDAREFAKQLNGVPLIRKASPWVHEDWVPNELHLDAGQWDDNRERYALSPEQLRQHVEDQVDTFRNRPSLFRSHWPSYEDQWTSATKTSEWNHAAVLDANRGQDLEGLPGPVKVPGYGQLHFGSHAGLQDVAQSYMEKAGLAYMPPRTYAKVDPYRAQRIAQEYEAMQHAPDDPRVQASYQAMINETMAQYQHLKDNGYQFEFYPPYDNPYPNSPREAVLDLHHNKHMYVYPTVAGFGSGTENLGDHPLLGWSGEEWNGMPVTHNDIFRAVHDVFGHAKEGVGFRADGEENAWRSHSAMYSPLARPAMTAETRGQNSWVNYGPHGATNRIADQASTVYADQKAGLLPDWVTHEGAGDERPAMVG